ncbi:MAG: argininosuccinate lyase [Planctomycetaceae bacterium]|nr:argininosuccinate lyase [Planctomycetaceae bacterium]
MARLWDKGKKTNEAALRFTVGNDHELDSKLIRFDIMGSIAHVRMLHASKLITKPELARLLKAYTQLLKEAERGKLKVSIEQEDCHTLIEQRLTKMLGPLGAKIHAGRSRNDQVVTMLRLAQRHYALAMQKHTLDVADALLTLAQRHKNVPMPGYTHMQRAMPSSVAAWALGYAEVLIEQADKFNTFHSALGRAASGSAAGYGVPMKLERWVAAKVQGYYNIQGVTSVQLTRGLDELWFTQLVQQTGVVISRMAADLVLFATKEFGFAKLPAELTTGSSIMPNKANPDLFELMRARGAALAGHPATITAVLAGLPGGYQRDLQIIKASLVASIEDGMTLLNAAALAIKGVTFDKERCAAALVPELYATAYAYQLVREGMPFREAYKKAAASPEKWKAGKYERGAEAADSQEYCDAWARQINAYLTAHKKRLRSIKRK